MQELWIILELVREFVVDGYPQAVCDDCIAEKLGIAFRQQACRMTRELANLPEFVRVEGVCDTCIDNKKKVIRYVQDE